MSENYTSMRDQIQSNGRKLAAEIPATVTQFAQLHKAALASGALEAKTKELIAIAISITSRCEGCIAFHIHDALKAGASKQEVAEAIGVAILMGGGPAMIYAGKAHEALEQFIAS